MASLQKRRPSALFYERRGCEEERLDSKARFWKTAPYLKRKREHEKPIPGEKC